jgi:hypothetical protein
MGQVDRMWRESVFDGVFFGSSLSPPIGRLEVFWNRSYRSCIDLVSVKLWSTEDSLRLYSWMTEMSAGISVV